MRDFPKNIFISVLCLIFYCCGESTPKKPKTDFTPPVKKLVYSENYGFDLSQYTVVSDTVREGNTLGLIFRACEIEKPIGEVLKKCKKVIDLRHISPGSSYTFLYTKDSIPKAKTFIYEPNLIDYYVVSLSDSIYAEKCSKDIVLKEKEYRGIIETSLWDTINEKNIDPYLAYELANIFAWTVDFFRLFKGDQFKVVLDERYLANGTYIGIDKVKYAIFEHNKEHFYAFRYVDNKNNVNYYDENGDSTRHTFLKSPLKFSRITSRFSRKRFHPVLKRWSAHKGTDYGAPRGTPIMATADGVVIASTRSKFNGKYVKIRHNSIYATQYLHMSRRAVRRGQKVKQGQVIGYVGSTGLATGSHVCYRFWKNKVQVNPLRQKLPKSKSLKKAFKADYFKQIEPQKKHLDQLNF